MKMNDAPGERLVERVARLSNFFNLQPHAKKQGLAQARALIRNSSFLKGEIRVSIQWQEAFPDKECYGSAVNVIVNKIAATGRIHNKLRQSIFFIEADQSGLQRKGLFAFFTARTEEIEHPIKEVPKQLGTAEFSLTTVDYLCLAVTEPALFVRRTFVAIGDRTCKHHPEDFFHAPSLFREKERLRLSSININSHPVTSLYYMVGQVLDA